MNLLINPKFKSLIPPLSDVERDQLEANLVADGCRDPLVTWDKTILDGHNRYEICKRKGIPFQTKELEFVDDDEASVWIIRNQFGRRNLTTFTRGELALKLEPLIAAKAKENQRHSDGRGKKGSQKSDNLNGRKFRCPSCKQDYFGNSHICRVDTKKEVAKAAGVSHDTIAKVKYILSEADEETKQELRTNPDKKVHRVAKDIKDKKEGERRAADLSARVAEAKKTPDQPGFLSGDFREVAKSIKAESVDLIFTDPPYDRKTLPLYGDLARVASEKLVEGGSLICYLGQYQIGEVINLVTPHLRLWWTLAVIHTGRSARMNEYGVVVKWKPMLWFVKGTRADKQTFVDDLVTSREEKDTHDWQQSVEEASYYIEKLCPKGGLVFDPFCGGGTTAVASKRLGRRFLTCDIDDGSLALAQERAA